MLHRRKQWEDIFRGIYRGDIEFDAPMKNYTSLAIGGLAEVLLSPADPLSAKNILLRLKEKNIPLLPFGGGTNTLVSDSGIEGAVIKLKAFQRIELLREDNGYVELFAEAGAPLQRLVNFCKENGYSGVEGLAGIPGTIGGGICGNAGSYGYEIKDVLVSLVIMDLEGRLDRFNAENLGFGYRRSDIPQGSIVLSATLRLKRDEKDSVSARTDSFFTEKKNTQPISERSAGCVFKNPEGLSAGKLIDESGCKGMKMGGITVSPFHANFFINSGGGTASDFINLMNEVLMIVGKKTGVMLDPEIKVVGKAW